MIPESYTWGVYRTGRETPVAVFLIQEDAEEFCRNVNSYGGSYEMREVEHNLYDVMVGERVVNDWGAVSADSAIELVNGHAELGITVRIVQA